MQDWVNHLESLIDLLADLGTSENDLAADEDEQDNLGLDHAVNQAREQLRFVRAEVVMLRSKAFKSDGKLDIARSHNVLDLEVGELGIESELLNDTSILARGKLGVVLRFGASYNHLSAGEDESRGLRLTDTHDDSRETLGIVLKAKSEAKLQKKKLHYVITHAQQSQLTSAFRACSAIVLRSRRQSKLTVATMFLRRLADYTSQAI